jgi:hypothetical protein
MTTFKPIPGYHGYLINHDGVVYSVKEKKIIKNFYDSYAIGLWGLDNQIKQKYQKVKLNNKKELIGNLMAITFMNADREKCIKFEYIDNDFTNNNVNNIRWWYKKKSSKILKKTYIEFLSKVQKDSETIEIIK